MINQWILLGYAASLIVILVVNLLYFLQIFKFRLPGDASLLVLMIHISLVLTVIFLTTFFIIGA